MLRDIIFLTIIFAISGCGMMGNSSKDNSCISLVSPDATVNDLNNSNNEVQLATTTREEESNPSLEENNIEPDNISITKSNILPQTISIEFPDILREEDNSKENNESNSSTPNHDTNETTNENNISTNIKENNESNISIENNETNESNKTNKINDIGYQQLKKNISQIEDVVTIARVNLVLLEKVMPQVLDKCEGMISCVFEPRFLSIVLDNETISTIDDIIDDSNITWIDKNSTNRLYLGKLSFSKFDTNRSNIFNYELTLDMVSDDIEFVYKNRDINKSKDDNITEYQTFKWSDDNKNVTTNYFYEDNKSTINISIFYFVDDEGKETMHVYNMNSNEELGVQENMNLTLADKEDDNSTLILQSNSIEQHFDGNESNISSFSANAEISDNSSRLRFSGSVHDESRDKNVTLTSELSCDNNSSCEDNNSTDDSLLDFYELSIKGGHLEDGSYVLLPPYTDIKGLKLIDIFGLTLGTFTIFENKAQGEIHNSSYNDMINELTILKIIESKDSDNMFEIVPKKDRPTIEIIGY